MAKRIFVVGFDLPGDEFEYVPFNSEQSLLDADIVLYEPSLGGYRGFEEYNGRPLLTHDGSVRIVENIRHWKSELAAATNAGKLVIVYLAKPQYCYRYTGQQQFSGTGRSRVTTNLVTDVSSYEAVPNVSSVEAKTGQQMKLASTASFLLPYWKEFGELSPYEAFVEGKFTEVLLTTRTGDKTVGAWFRGKGALLLLPPIRYDEKAFLKYDKDERSRVWTPEALKFGKRLSATLVALSDSLRAGRARTPPPAWAQDRKWATQVEQHVLDEISAVTSSISELQERRTDLERQLDEAGVLRGLLYEQGPQLERPVREALTLFGFVAKAFKGGDSEFDVVFESKEGRFLGEVEGKDSRAINIDKMSQLERNLQEDFARDEVTAYAKGVLFGNNERLTLPAILRLAAPRIAKTGGGGAFLRVKWPWGQVIVATAANLIPIVGGVADSDDDCWRHVPVVSELGLNMGGAAEKEIPVENVEHGVSDFGVNRERRGD
jgi:hypothetical protein